MAWEIPLRLLSLRATVKRLNNMSGEYDNTVYTDLPCRIALHRDNIFRDQMHVSSELEQTLFIFNYLFSGNPVDIRMEDRVEIDGKKYRVLKVSNAESSNHHFEASVEQLKTPNRGAV